MVRFRFFFIPLVSFGIFLLTSFPLKAETDFALESGNKFTAKLLSEYGQISNFLYQNNNDEEATNYIKIEPSIFIQTQLSRHLMQLEAILVVINLVTLVRMNIAIYYSNRTISLSSIIIKHCLLMLSYMKSMNIAVRIYL
jgi:hypothetical protein